MLPNTADLPLIYKTLNCIGQGLEKTRLDPIQLDADILCRKAIQQAQLDDFGNEYFREGLTRLIESFKQDANLHYFGKIITQRVMINYLTQRLFLADHLKKIVSQKRSPLNPPIIVTGVPRSGTTFLHRMLNLDHQNESVPFWRLYRPFAQHNKKDNRRETARQEINLRRPAYPEIDTKHFIREDQGEECIWMTGITLSSIVFWVLAPVSSYATWLFKQDRRPYYQEYRELLEVQQEYCSNHTLVLKAPDHTPNLDVLIDEIPNIRIIQMHRNPVTCLTSLNSLFYSTHKSVTRDLNPRRIGEINQQMYFHYLNRSRAVKQERNSPHAILDVQYKQLVQNPIGTVKGIYQHFDIPFSNDFQDQLMAYVSENSKNKYGKHHYSPEQFGQDKKDLEKYFEQNFPEEFNQ